MYINKQINNTFYTVKRQQQNQPINILYDDSGYFFDAAITSDSKHCLIPISITEKNSEFINSSPYSAVWINDIVNFSQKIPKYGDYCTSLILAIHSSPPSLLKREDLIILNKNIDQYKFVSFYEGHNRWPMKNIEYIPYGLPCQNFRNEKNREKDILVINLKRQKQIDILYQYIKQKFPLTDMIHENILNLDSIHKTMSEYKICIDIDNYYNLLLANSCGCLGITALESSDETVINIKSSNEILDMIPKLLVNVQHADISEQIIKKYNWQIFCQNINNYTKKILDKGFII